MPPPVPTPGPADGKVPTDARPILVMSALPCLHVEPATGPVQFARRWRRVGIDESLQLLAQISRHAFPVNRVVRTRHGVHKRGIAHVHAADTTPFAGINNGQSGIWHTVAARRLRVRETCRLIETSPASVPRPPPDCSGFGQRRHIRRCGLRNGAGIRVPFEVRQLHRHANGPPSIDIG